jgi:hypothetical protein
MRTVLGILSLASLAVCTAAPFLFFSGRLGMDMYKTVLLAASVAYFMFATAWAARKA